MVIIELVLYYFLAVGLKKIAPKINVHYVTLFIVAGIFLGIGGINFISSEAYQISKVIKFLAIYFLLFKVGLHLELDGLNKHIKAITFIGIIPAVLEALILGYVASYFLGISQLHGLILGFFMSTVTPSLSAPSLINLRDKVSNKETINVILTSLPIDIIFSTTMVFILLIFVPNQSGDIYMSISFIGTVCLGYFISVTKYYQKASLITRQIWKVVSIYPYMFLGAQLIPEDLFAHFNVYVSMIVFSLLAKTIGLLVALKRSKLNRNEKGLVIASFIPKSTIQADMIDIILPIFMLLPFDFETYVVFESLVALIISGYLINYFKKKLYKEKHYG